MSSLRHISNSKIVLRILYYIWVAFPYPIRKPLTAGFIASVLLMKKLTGVNNRNAPTSMNNLGNLSFWGVPKLKVNQYALEIGGNVANPLRLTYEDLTKLYAVERPVRMDCVGGFRNNSRMKGVQLWRLFQLAGVESKAGAAVFYCADGYYTAHLLSDLVSSDAFMAYEINGEQIDRFGHPLRLAAPGA